MSKSFKGAGQKTSLLSIVILTLVWHVPCWACLHPGRSHSSPSPHTHKILPALSLEWGLTCGSSVKMWFVRSRGQYKRLHTAGVSDRQALIYGPGPQQHVPKLHREPCLTCVHWVRSPTQVMGAPLSGSSLRAYVVTGGGLYLSKALRPKVRASVASTTTHLVKPPAFTLCLHSTRPGS